LDQLIKNANFDRLPDLASSEAGFVASDATDEQEKTVQVPPPTCYWNCY